MNRFEVTYTFVGKKYRTLVKAPTPERAKEILLNQFSFHSIVKEEPCTQHQPTTSK